MKKNILIIMTLLVLPFFSQAKEMTINLDAVKITFLADMQKTAGSVSGLKAHINFNMDDLSKSNISGTVDVKTLNTGTPKRDEHLKSADYFDAEKYPTMSFGSISFAKENGKFVMKGKMKIKDVEREETIIFSFENNIFKGQCTIQASNYKLGNFADKGPEKTNVVITFVIPVS